MTASFDRIADLYRREFAGELDRKPFDRELLDRVARRFPRGAPVLEVGSGPAHVGAYLRTRGVPVIASDASVGQVREARVLAVEERTVRPPYDDEQQTDRCYVVATRSGG